MMTSTEQQVELGCLGGNNSLSICNVCSGILKHNKNQGKKHSLLKKYDMCINLLIKSK